MNPHANPAPPDGAVPEEFDPGRTRLVPVDGTSARDGAPALEESVAAACRLVPPLWTLRSFVAVNPFLGFSDLPFREAAAEVDRLFHGRAFMPLAFYREEYARGRIGEDDLRSAVERAPELLGRPELAREGSDRLRRVLLLDPGQDGCGAARVETLAEAVDRAEGTSFAALVVDQIARWCGARFDRGQAAWKQPWKEMAPYPAWREWARIDLDPELRGLAGFRSYVAALPGKPMQAIGAVLEQLGLPPAAHRDYLARALASVAGWAGHLQCRAREADLRGEVDDALCHLLAIRLAFDGGIDRALGGRSALLRSSRGPGAPRVPDGALRETELCWLWQHAYEAGYRRLLLGKLAAGGTADGPARATRTAERPFLQAAFCIDVRSEVLRRQLESGSPDVQTLGFAGFFGVPIETVAPGDGAGAARCPVLIAPAFRIRERAPAGSQAEAHALRARERHERFGAMRKLAVGAFPLVETVGHFFGLRLVTDSLGWTRPHEGGALFEARSRRELSPSLEVEHRDGQRFGLTLAEQIDVAEAVLRNMGLTEGFAEVVLLCGHGSLSTNNPYASGLDCGACGGHRGDANARVAAAILESPAVREGLAGRGIQVPGTTRFVAGLHDTTRDTVSLLDAGGLSAEKRDRVERALEAACRRTREERAPRLGERRGRNLARRLRRRAGDWSEMRPEWGLAGNAAFVAAPRARTRGLDLEGRVFLHDYDPTADTDGRVLELILSAPLVVASWINLQYYASTVDNDVFGSGDKALHNVVGRHGVMLGNRSDLRPGLPWQSVHDGRRFVHEPLRLTAIVEAPEERIERVLDAHPEVRELLDNGWVHLLAWEPEDGILRRWVGGDERWVLE